MKLKHFIIAIVIILIVTFWGSLTVNGLVTYWGKHLEWGSGSEDIWIGFWGSILGAIIGCLGVIFTTYYMISNGDRTQRDLILLNLELETIKQINTNLSEVENSFNRFSELAEDYIKKVGNNVSGTAVTELEEKFYKERRNLDKLVGRFYNNESLFTEDLSAFSNLLSDLRRNVKYISRKVRDCDNKNAAKTLDEYIELNDKVEDVIDSLLLQINIRHTEEYIKFSSARDSKIDIKESLKNILNKINK